MSIQADDVGQYKCVKLSENGENISTFNIEINDNK